MVRQHTRKLEKTIKNLLEKHFLRTNLPHQRLQFGPTHIVLKRTQFELRRGTVQDTDAKSMAFVFPFSHDPALALVFA